MKLVLAVRTDNPEAELYLYRDSVIQDSLKWQAHRQLSDTILSKIDEFLLKNNHELNELSGLVVFRGPGSFTGLRIGISIVNALSYSLSIPAVGGEGSDWINDALKAFEPNRENSVITPLYGSEAHITKPRK